MMNKQECIDHLNSLAKDHLCCRLDDKDPDYIPADLQEGTYRWFLYMYSNMYKKSEDKISNKDKMAFLYVYRKLRDEHVICWARETLIGLDHSKKDDILKCILSNILNTDSFNELRVNLYLYRNIKNDLMIADPYILSLSKNLEKFKNA